MKNPFSCSQVVTYGRTDRAEPMDEFLQLILTNFNMSVSQLYSQYLYEASFWKSRIYFKMSLIFFVRYNSFESVPPLWILGILQIDCRHIYVLAYVVNRGRGHVVRKCSFIVSTPQQSNHNFKIF
jgi:hypothetical protein